MGGIDMGMLLFVIAPIIILTAFAVFFINGYNQSQMHHDA